MNKLIICALPILVGCAQFVTAREVTDRREARQCFETGLIWQDALQEYCTNPDTGMEGYDSVDECLSAMAGHRDELFIVQLYVTTRGYDRRVDLKRCLGGD